jgi:pilus assembly protein Flp/PilA
MLLFFSFLQARLQNEDRGATAVEYGLLLAGVAALIITALFLLGPAVATMFSDMTAEL